MISPVDDVGTHAPNQRLIIAVTAGCRKSLSVQAARSRVLSGLLRITPACTDGTTIAVAETLEVDVAVIGVVDSGLGCWVDEPNSWGSVSLSRALSLQHKDLREPSLALGCPLSRLLLLL